MHKWQHQVTGLHLSPEILLSSLIGPRGVQQAHIHALWAIPRAAECGYGGTKLQSLLAACHP